MAKKSKRADGCECGQPHLTRHGNPSCTGHCSGRLRPEIAGKPCRNDPRKGSTVCKNHGGKAPQVEAKAEQREEQKRVEDLARKLIPDPEDRSPITDPLARLLDLASEIDAFRESLRVLSNQLNNRIRYSADGAGTEQLRAEVATYRAAVQDVTGMLIAIAKLNIDDRLARIEARKVELTLTALQAGLNDAKLPAQTKRTVMASVGRHLRAVAG